MKNTNLIIGKKGIGKTTGIMFSEIKNLINENTNLLIIDNKEEYYKTYANILKENGYEVNVINFKDSTKSNGFNPLYMPYKLYKNGSKDIAIKIIDNFSKSLMHKQGVMDPFWTDSASSYLTGLILLLFKEASEEEINIGSIQVMISEIEKDIEKVRNYINKLDLVSPEYTYLSTTVNAPNETRGGIVSVLKMELTKYISTENLLNMLTTNDIDLTKEEKKAIFVIGNEDYNKLTNVVISEVINSNNKYSYIFDNFDSLDNILNFGDLLEENNKVYVISRNLDNIKEKYGNYITDKFDNIMTIEEGGNLEEVGDFDEYPTIEKHQNKYFDLNNVL